MTHPEPRFPFLSTRIILLFVVALGLVLGIACVVLMPRPDASKWQAVFLSNGQVYFGKLSLRPQAYVLKDIYYLQVPQGLQQGDQNAANPANINLVKLGQELHGPEDVMYIDRDKVLFWENLKDSSKVVEAIASTGK